MCELAYPDRRSWSAKWHCYAEFYRQSAGIAQCFNRSKSVCSELAQMLYVRPSSLLVLFVCKSTCTVYVSVHVCTAIAVAVGMLPASTEGDDSIVQGFSEVLGPTRLLPLTCGIPFSDSYKCSMFPCYCEYARQSDKAHE